MCIKMKALAEGRIKPRSLKSQVNLNHWIIFLSRVNAACAHCVQTGERFTGEITSATIIHVCTWI